MPIALNHSVAAVHRGDLYVMGGYTSPTGLNRAVAALLRYDPEQRSLVAAARAPTRRAAHAMGVIGNRLYVAGGARGGRALRSLEIYGFRRRRWSRGPRMRTAREHVAGTVAGGRFYVLAGRAAGQGNFKVAERYDPRRRRWQRLPDMRKPRGGIAAAAVGRRVVVFGGEEVGRHDRRGRAVRPGPARVVALPDLATPRHGLGGVSRGRRVYAIEGGPTPGFDFSTAIEVLDLPGWVSSALERCAVGLGAAGNFNSGVRPGPGDPIPRSPARSRNPASGRPRSRRRGSERDAAETVPGRAHAGQRRPRASGRVESLDLADRAGALLAAEHDDPPGDGRRARSRRAASACGQPLPAPLGGPVTLGDVKLPWPAARPAST